LFLPLFPVIVPVLSVLSFLVLILPTVATVFTIGFDSELHPETKLEGQGAGGRGQASTPVTYVYAVIERTVLSNGDENRLMIRARVDAAHSVETSIQAVCDFGGQDAILGRRVETFEECEILWIQRIFRLQSRN